MDQTLAHGARRRRRADQGLAPKAAPADRGANHRRLRVGVISKASFVSFQSALAACLAAAVA